MTVYMMIFFSTGKYHESVTVLPWVVLVMSGNAVAGSISVCYFPVYTPGST